MPQNPSPCCPVRERCHLTTEPQAPLPQEQSLAKEVFAILITSQLSWIKLIKLLVAPAWITAQEGMNSHKMAFL